MTASLDVTVIKTTCICGAKMAYLIENKDSEILHCARCGRLLHQSKVSDYKAWYVPEAKIKGFWQLEY